MFNVNGSTINISCGDTGSVDVNVDYDFSTDDRALFTVKNSNGAIVMERIYEIENRKFTIYFTNSDTDKLSAGGYPYDIRFVINPRYMDGKIVDGDQVITPNAPGLQSTTATINILPVVGEI